MPASFFDSLYFPLSGFLIALVFLMYCLSKMLESFVRATPVSGISPAASKAVESAKPVKTADKQVPAKTETAKSEIGKPQAAPVVKSASAARPDAKPAARPAPASAGSAKTEPAKSPVVSAEIPVSAQVFVPAAEVLKADLLKADKNAAARPVSASASGIAAEIADFRVQLDEMKYMVEQRKSLHEKQIVDIIRNINGIVNRLETLEPEYLAEIQPSLQYLVFELENIRAAGGAAAPAAKK